MTIANPLRDARDRRSIRIMATPNRPPESARLCSQCLHERNDHGIRVCGRSSPRPDRVHGVDFYQACALQRSLPRLLAWLARECGRPGRYWEPRYPF